MINNSKEIQIPVIPIYNLLILPHVKFYIRLDNTYKQKCEEFMRTTKNAWIFVTLGHPQTKKLIRVGTVCFISRVEYNEDHILLHALGMFRAKFHDSIKTDDVEPFNPTKIVFLLDEPLNPSVDELELINQNINKVKTKIMDWLMLISKDVPNVMDMVIKSQQAINTINDFYKLEKFLNEIFTYTSFASIKVLVLILATDNINKRMELMIRCLNEMCKNFKQQKIQNEGVAEMLNGLNPEQKNDYGRLNKRYEKIKDIIPENIRVAIEEDLAKLKIVQGASESSEKSNIISHLEFLLGLPWGKYTASPTDFNKVKEILDADHYGLTHIKERIMEFLAVKQLNPKSRSSVLCFIGPPGVGKTSLGQSIARALNKKFIRISLGGIYDESEIRGHRRTYIGALPGKILQEIKRCGSLNPVFMIDEVDKIGRSAVHGDPSSALLEVLDPEQNFAFTDNYVATGVDLSQVLFITTANTNNIQKPLLDRMEVIYLPGYTEFEKTQIAKQFLVSRQLKECGLIDKIDVAFADEIISLIIRDYTDEAGVRELERKIAKVFRKIAKDYLLLKSEVRAFSMTEEFVRGALGPKIFQKNRARKTPVGVATALAWTETGGTILFVEAVQFNSRQEKKLSQTGSLGDVFKESIKIALSLIRSKYHPSYIDIDDNVFHVHVPEGSIPKDGPSAGITIFTALYSLISKKEVKEYFAMSGEINLEGMILPVGGIREKVIAAERAGIKEVILPRANEGDIEDIPQEIKSKVIFHFVNSVDEVIKIAFK